MSTHVDMHGSVYLLPALFWDDNEVLEATRTSISVWQNFWLWWTRTSGYLPAVYYQTQYHKQGNKSKLTTYLEKWRNKNGILKDGYLIHAVPQVITLGRSIVVIMQVHLNASLENILSEIMLQHQKKWSPL